MKVLSHGQIAILVIPDGWMKKEEEHSPFALTGARSLTWYQPPDNAQVGIYLYYRGMPVVEEGSKEAHQAVLATEPHKLCREEIDSIWEVLGNCYNSKAYKMESCRTIDHHGRRIIEVEGVYRNSDLRTLEYAVDADGSGRFVQSIWFQAPESVYFYFEQQGRRALEEIEWLPLALPQMQSITLPDGTILTEKSTSGEFHAATLARYSGSWTPTKEEDDTLTAWIKWSL